MTLKDEELRELQYLVGKRESEGLTPEEENRIKKLVSQQQEIPKNAKIEDIIVIALIIIGVAVIIAALSKK